MESVDIDLNGEFGNFINKHPDLFTISWKSALDALQEEGVFFYKENRNADPKMLPTSMPAFLLNVEYDQLMERSRKVRNEISRVVRKKIDESPSFFEISRTILDLFKIDPGYNRSELNTLFTRGDWLGSPSNPQHVEENADCPAGMGYNHVVNQAWKGTPVVRGFVRELSRKYGITFTLEAPDPFKDVIDAIWGAYNQFRGKDSSAKPSILFLHDGQSGLYVPEDHFFIRKLLQIGYYARLAYIDDYKGFQDGMVVDENSSRPYDVVFRRFGADDITRALEDKDTPTQKQDNYYRLIEAYANRKVCILPSLGQGVLADKGFSSITCTAVPEAVPPTYIANAIPAEVSGSIQALEGRYVLKKRTETWGGHHVVINPASVQERFAELNLSQREKWVIQQKVAVPRFPTRDGNGLFYNINLYKYALFGRSSQQGDEAPINVGSGGGLFPIYVLRSISER